MLGGLLAGVAGATGFSGVESFASPACVSMASLAMAGEPTADKSGGEGALSEGAGGHSPCRGDSRALEKHGASNWGGKRRGAWVVSFVVP